MPSLPLWTPQLSVRNATLDAQHITLLELNRELLRVLDDKPETDGPIYVLLNDFATSFRKHLAYEEQLLEANHCPDFIAHREEHRKILAVLDGYLACAHTNCCNRAQLAQAARHWMEHHLCESDLPLRDYMKDATQQDAAHAEPANAG